MLQKALKWIGEKWPHFDIVKDKDGVSTLYLRRWFIFRSRYGNVYLHHIVQPDSDRDLHDHPWDFRTTVLSGGYVERGITALTTLRAGDSVSRLAERSHKIVIVFENTYTLVFTGPYKREWGFTTPDGWVHWRAYLNVPGTGKGEFD